MPVLAEEVFDLFSEIYDQERREDLSLTDYLMGCCDNPMMYSSAAERMIAAIGEPEIIDTSADSRLGRIFLNRTIKIYPAFRNFYGMENTIQRIVGYFQYAAQGLEERKQILYLLGPVGGGKSSLAEQLKQLMEKQPIYVLKAGDEISPLFESPLGLFDPTHMGDLLSDKYGIAKRRLTGLISPWATKRLDEFDGDISKFSVVKIQPSKLRQIAIAKTEPGDENNQDISALVGKIDIRKLEHFSQNDPDAYSFSGGLNRTTQGLLEFVEMFKAPIKVLHPLLTATQERNYSGTENLGSFPYQGVVLAHSNEAEWQQFKQNKNNEAFLDRICVVKVPYCLQVDEESLVVLVLLELLPLGLISPWATKRLDEFDGDISKFSVVKIQPSKLRQIAIAKTEPGDENNQDISALVGKIDIRKLEHFSQNDPDAYSFSGGLNRTTQGLLEFVEMFKAPIKVLHPLLTATQERNYSGTENLGSFPYQGVVLAHSNEAEWQQFKQNKNNEAFLDRICVVKVPYCLQVDEESQIYKKLLRESELDDAACAPEVLEILSRFSVLSRLHEHENSSIYSKMRIYDGESLKDTDPKAKSIQEYRETAGVNEGMTGISTRFAFKVLSETFNHDTDEVAADPVHLIYVLEQTVKREQFSEEIESRYLDFIKSELIPRYAEFIGHEIQKTYLESYGEYGQNLFDRYIAYADAWIEEQDYKDPDTGQVFDREILDAELSKIEKPAGIANPKDFRNEVVKFSLRTRANEKGKNPSWTSYNKIREVIEKRMFSQVEELLPVISFGSKKDKKTDKQHTEFVHRMVERGYTERQVRRLVEWYMRVNKAG